VSDLEAKLRALLLEDGCCPATAGELALEFCGKTHKRRERERKENVAQQKLRFGRMAVAEAIGCHPNYAYEIAERGAKKFSGF
jgi:hypothetical protein